MKYLYLDTETGGLHATTDALLTIGLVAHDDVKGILGTSHIRVKPDGLVCDEKAMAVNRIVLSEHSALAFDRKTAALEVNKFVHTHFGTWYKDAPFVIGHNIQFDRIFMDKLFLDAGVKPAYSYRSMDTMGIALFLGDLGLLKLENLKLDTLLTHYNVHIDDADRHTALGDALVTRLVHLAMRNEIQSRLQAV